MDSGTFEIKLKLIELIGESDTYHELRNNVTLRAHGILRDCKDIEGPLGQLIRSYAVSFLRDCGVADPLDEESK